MSTSFDSVMSCAELTREHVVAALESRAATRALLGRLTRVAASGDAIDRIFLVLATIAGGYADWFDSEMRVELEPHGETTQVHVLVDLGSGQRERLFPTFTLGIPFVEVEETVSLALGQLAPLEILPAARGLVLSTLEDDGGWGDDRVFVDAASIDADATVGVFEPLPPSARPTPAPVVTAPAPAVTSPAPAPTTTVPVPPRPAQREAVPPAPESSAPLLVPMPDPSAHPQGRPTVRMKVVVPEAAQAPAAAAPEDRAKATLRAPATTRAEVAREQALQYMNEKVDGLNPPTPKFVVSAELLAELREDDSMPPPASDTTSEGSRDEAAGDRRGPRR